jgi:hypothetical protein
MTSLPHKADSIGKGTNFICNFAFKIEKTAKNLALAELFHDSSKEKCIFL